MLPLVTSPLQARMHAALAAGQHTLECSLDLGRSSSRVELGADGWCWRDLRYPWIEPCRERTIYHPVRHDGGALAFMPVVRYSGSLLKLVPTEWGPPTFEIDGIKMLPTARISPWEDAGRKVALVRPLGRRILDTCGGLGYFAARALEAGAACVQSFEKNPDVIWLRSLNPWSPTAAGDQRLLLECADVTTRLAAFDDRSFDAILHDPPRFGIAGELYSSEFYATLARLLVPAGRLFHYTGTPNRLTTGRDLPREVAKRLSRVGFEARLHGDGVLAVRRG
ncbi:MAG: SAM-dependent methyltransferase [Sinobacteraceae bacterium]|nr:SAM-dependent methyltransferase [Nevskiaceae bacterium]MCP5338966.1 SAM-dependent methyltransferase [Nevskiaceae bacterium]MCP5359621.1 SAM-dependent methyltransferase [Nevskiaceae bacterium]MCP5472585.1 SAM-dependent methyltransferase [Nevskiaceae bacterium]